MKKIFILTLSLIFVLSSFVYGENEDNEVEVTIPRFDVTINGRLIDSTSEQYPLITYKGITYIPMTWNMTHALGLDFKWSAENGITVKQAEEAEFLDQKGGYENSIYKTYKATISKEQVEVNGRFIDNTTEEYPLLNFRYVTYFPMTYQYMKLDFGTAYNYSDTRGLFVSVNPDIPVTYPESTIIKEDIIVEDLVENAGYVCKYFKVEENSYKNKNLFMNYTLQDYQNDIFNVSINYYNKKDKYLYTQDYVVGGIYKPSKYGNFGFGNTVLHNWNVDYIGRMEVVIEFLNPEVAKAKAFEVINKETIEIERLNSNEVTKEKLLSDGAKYIYPLRDISSDRNVRPEDDYANYGVIFNTGGLLVEGKEGRYTILDIKNNSFDKLTNSYWLVSFYSDFKYKTEDSLYKMFEGYSNNALYKESYGQIIKLFDKDYNLIKIYIVEDQLND